MIWNSGWRLASAVSNEGGLGLIGSGSMYPDVLREHLKKCQAATEKPFGVNVPLFYPNIDKHIETILEFKVPIVFTSGGNPKLYTETLQKEGIKVAHLVSSTKFAQKAEEAGVDAIVAEGFEAGGHDGREETTTFCLIPDVRRRTDLPLIAAGGIATGRQILAAMVLGADGVQMGSRFAATEESSAHESYKKLIAGTKDGDTVLTLKELIPVRLIKSPFYDRVLEAYANYAGKEELTELLGRRRPKKGMFEGNWEEGEFQAGQSSALIDEILTVQEVFEELKKETKIFNQEVFNIFL